VAINLPFTHWGTQCQPAISEVAEDGRIEPVEGFRQYQNAIGQRRKRELSRKLGGRASDLLT
jgi:hypothetical protein